MNLVVPMTLTTILCYPKPHKDAELVTASESFHTALSTGDYRTYCEMKATTAETEGDKQVWSLMKVICFEENARGELLSHLGFDAAAIAAAAEQYVKKKSPASSSSLASISPAGERQYELYLCTQLYCISDGKLKVARC
jgi:hypothetical protein